MIRYAIWVAVSTQEQATGDKASLVEQEAQCRAKANAKGWLETHAPFVVPGESRTRWVNLRDAEDAIPALHDMLDSAQRGEFDVVVLYDYSRLRELLDQVSRTLAAYHVQLYSIGQPVEPQSPEQFDPYMTDTSNAVQFVSKLTSGAEINALRRRYRLGVPRRVSDKGLHPVGVLPYGYRKPPGRETDRDVVPVLDPAIANVLRLAKDKFLSGMSLPEVVKWMNTTGVKPRKGGSWSWTSLNHILRNPFYAGVVSHGLYRSVRDPRTGNSRVTLTKDRAKILEAEGKHEALWSIEEHRLILDEYKRRWRTYKGSKTHRLSRLLYCGVCGSALHVTYIRHTGDEPTDDNRGWYCRQGHGEGRKWETFIMDNLAVQLVADRLVVDIAKQKLSELPNPISHAPEFQKALSDLLERKERLTDALEDGTLDVASYRERVKSLDTRISQVKAELEGVEAELQGAASRHKMFMSLAEAIDTAPDFVFHAPAHEVNTALRLLVARIVVNEGKVTIEYR